MPSSRRDPVISQVLNERNQGHDTRRRLFINLERILGRPVVSYFTSFVFPVGIEDTDADMLEGVLQKIDLSDGLAIVISSPGGQGLAAERIINVCRSYSGTGEYWAIVPGKAKSAATMVCFGASKILMGVNSELGIVDPQLTIVESGNTKWFSAYNVVKSYEDLFDRAVAEEGRLEPYLQQLANYDEREIAEMRASLELSKDIAVRALRTGMMKCRLEEDIESKIRVFLTPEKAKTHGRPIYKDDALVCGLNIQEVKPKERLWELIYELYIRANDYVSRDFAKCIESKNHLFQASAGRREE